MCTYRRFGWELCELLESDPVLSFHSRLRLNQINIEGSKLSNLCVDSNRITSNQCVIENTKKTPKLTEIIDWGSQNQNAKKVYFHTIKYDNMCFLHFYCNDKIQIYFQTSSFIKLYSNIAWKSERQQILVTIIRSKDALDQVKNVVRFHLFFLNSPRNVRLETAAA